ncbi:MULTISPECIES: MarR family winged helix-turn-helix transcriptional regulator [Listeria]|uniref:MarR family winged helix-turn-helix transcriptional regulator n=1 Tax=Listeria TaxID=1637 RepID=UPI000B5905C3|nr:MULTISPECIES: MarR family transcriptional regulator [Listeria]
METNHRLLDEQLCFAIYNVQRNFTKYYRKALSPFQLTYPQYIVLLALWEQDAQSVMELGAQLDLDSGTLTPLLKRMEQDGLVLRNRKQSDERVVIISLTEKGSQLEGAVIGAVNACIQQLFSGQVGHTNLLADVKNLNETLKSYLI